MALENAFGIFQHVFVMFGAEDAPFGRILSTAWKNCLRILS
jgi:hypothetical protein